MAAMVDRAQTDGSLVILSDSLSSCSIYHLIAKVAAAQILDLNLDIGLILDEFEEACVVGIKVSVKRKNPCSSEVC